MSQPSTKTDAKDRGHSSAKRKSDAVPHLLRGGDFDAHSRELGIVVATLPAWRDSFLDGGTAAMKGRPSDGRDEVISRLQAKVGQLTMDNEQLGRKCRHLVCGRPSAAKRRSN